MTPPVWRGHCPHFVCFSAQATGEDFRRVALAKRPQYKVKKDQQWSLPNLQACAPSCTTASLTPRADCAPGFVAGTQYTDLVQAMSRTAFGGRNVGEAADVLYEMVTNPECLVVGTFSGAMTVAKMGLVLCDMIEQGMLQAVITTGALMAHGFVEASGRVHFKYDPGLDDKELYYRGYNRVYDTLEPEQNLDDVAEIFSDVLSEVEPSETLCSYKINRLLGRTARHTTGRGILKSAYEHNVPVYVPAFTDSEIGLDFASPTAASACWKPPLAYDPFLDLEHYTESVRPQKPLVFSPLAVVCRATGDSRLAPIWS